VTIRRDEIRRILWEEWDPIGVNSNDHLRDEYDGYADQIYALLKLGGQKDEIAEYLRWAAVENMGLSEAGSVRAIASKIAGDP
jgi:hypothetical protein